jgi:dienelactone hydrolase
VKFLPALLALSFIAAAETPNDRRLQPLKDLDGDFSWKPSASPDAWQTRADAVRTQTKVALGLWPEPTRTPLNPVIHGRIEKEDYTVEKVFFESMPGFFVTGNLYRPKDQSKKYPAVICAHGHWTDARFMEVKDAEIKRQIEAGEERSPINARNMFQSIGSQLARMGCVAFIVDMLGNSDSQQIDMQVAHRFAKQRQEMISAEPGQWGLYSPQAETHGQSIMGLQTWNNVRLLDFLSTLPDVDAKRLAITGASGGGTQSMILAAIDPRVAVAAPCVMVSTAMQGGCTCENASLLRIGTGNIEFAALFAPKPMGLTTAKDWTINLPTKGFPDLKAHWQMLGAPDNVELWHYPHFPHNYNMVTREHIYAFFNKHFKMGLPAERLKEREFEPLTREQLSVWDTQHPAPPSGPAFEKKLLGWWTQDAETKRAKDIPGFRKLAQPALEAIAGTTLKVAGDVKASAMKTREVTAEKKPALQVSDFTIANTTRSEEVPAQAIGFAGKGEPLAIYLSAGGKADLLAEGAANAPVRKLVARGTAVLGADLFLQGAFLAPGTSDSPAPKVKNPREAASYTHGYNHSVTIERVRDVLTLLRWAQGLEQKPRSITLIALDSATAPVAAAAAALAGNTVDKLVLDTGAFRFQKVRDIRDPLFVPCIAQAGDLPGLLALGAPRKLFLMGEGRIGPDIVTAAYETAGVADTLRVSETRDLDAAVNWLLEQSR